MTQSTARILVADGAELVRRGICDVLAQDRRLTVVGQVTWVLDVPNAALKCAPDLIFFGLTRVGDVHDRSSEIDALRRAVQNSSARVIALVDDGDVNALIEAVRAGASAVLCRDASARVMLDAVWSVLEGEGALDPRFARSLFAYLAAPTGAEGAAPALRPAVLRLLSPRERDVLMRLAQAKRNKEIALELGVSVGTVKTHLRHIFSKLTVTDRTGAVLMALEAHDLEAAA